jgi:hypothetical protein
MISLSSFARLGALAALAAATSFVARDAHAMTYLMMRDDVLLAQSPVVVGGEVIALWPGAKNRAGQVVETHYAVRVDRISKGKVDASLITVALPGATDRTQDGLEVHGVPRYAAGDEVLFFLEPRDDGAYQPVQLALGAFRAFDYAGDRYYRRDLDPQDAIEKSFNAEYTLPRRGGKFVAWIESAATSAKSATPDYLGALPPDAEAKFTLIRHGDGHPVRWFKFDGGQSENWYALSGGQAGMSTNVYAQVASAVNVWTNDAGSRINLVYAGQTGSDAMNNGTDGRSAITFNDPQDKTSGSFSCSSGGTLAFGGPYFSSNTTTFNGAPYHAAVEGFVVVQDGAGCSMDRNGGADGAEMLAHEIGHTLGLGHACGDSKSPACNTSATLDDAVMRAYIHADGRGATLRSDDRAAIALLYPQPAGSGGGGTRPDSIYGNTFE